MPIRKILIKEGANAQEQYIELKSFGNNDLAFTDESKTITYTEHFLSLDGSILNVSNTGTGSAPLPESQIAEPYHTGIRRISPSSISGLTSKSVDQIGFSNSLIYSLDGITGISWWARPDLAADAVDDNWKLLFGFCDSDNIEPDRGIYFLYDYEGFGKSNNFRAVIRNNGAVVQTELPNAYLDNSLQWRHFAIIIDSTVPELAAYFYYGTETTPLMLQDKITTTQINNAGAAFPAIDVAEDMNIYYGLEKKDTSAILRVLDVDSITFYKRAI